LGYKNGNIADVLSKNGAQHTAVSLFGLAISVKFAQFANASSLRIWFLYSLLTCIHMISNYHLMKILSLRSLNKIRLNLLINKFINSEVINNYMNNYFKNNNKEKGINKIELKMVNKEYQPLI
jgi:Vitamin B6 photo-protection and homoeostasis